MRQAMNKTLKHFTVELPLFAVCFCLVLSLSVASAEEKKASPRPLSEIGPKAKPVEPPTAEAIEKALLRGVAFLVADQNPNGSWGSAEQTKDLNIYAPVPGAHHAFRSAVTGMCVSALIEAGGSSAEVNLAIDRGETWLLENLPKLRRATSDALYN